jgi:hypothetical protein
MTIAKTCLFIALLGYSTVVLTTIFIPKNEIFYRCGQAPYYEKSNTLDVIFIGSSHVEWGIDPNTIWEKYGIPAINYTVLGLDLKHSYFLLKEMLKYHQPKVMVIDVWRICDENDANALTNRIANMFPFSWNKIEMINSNPNLDSLHKKMDYYFPLHLYHTRKLDSTDFNFHYHNIERGHFVNFDKKNQEHVFNDCNTIASLTKTEVSYFERIIAYAKQEKIKLIFVSIPHLSSKIDLLKKINAIELLSNKNGIPFINFNKEKSFKAAGLIYSTDVANDSDINGHLNHLGAQKIASFLGEYLQKNYHLANKSKDIAYNFLNENLLTYKTNIKNNFPFSVPTKGNKLEQGMSLLPGDYLSSANNQYKLILQNDGNLVLYNKDNIHTWATFTPINGMVNLIMQEDGNLVLYGQNSTQFWASNTANKPNSFLILQDDGNLVIYQNNIPTWSSNTAQ